MKLKTKIMLFKRTKQTQMELDTDWKTARRITIEFLRHSYAAKQFVKQYKAVVNTQTISRKLDNGKPDPKNVVIYSWAYPIDFYDDTDDI